MQIHYVYGYLRSVKSEVGDIKTPYYIGKGKNNRYKSKHRVKIPQNLNDIIFYAKNISNFEACKIERILIKKYGRFGIDKTGILRNITTGGEDNNGDANPMFGRKHKPETIARWKIIRKGRKNHVLSKLLKDGRRIGKLNNMYGKKHSENARRLMSEKALINKKGEKNPMYGKKHSENTRRLISEKATGRKVSEETRQKLKNRQRYNCIHCNMLCTKSNIVRWHDNKCKLNAQKL